MLRTPRLPKEKGFYLIGTLGELWIRYYLPIILLILVVLSTVLSPFFLTKENLVDILSSNVTLGLLAIGMFFVIVTGGIDLSVPSVVAFTGCILAGLLDANISWPVALLVSLAMAVVSGAICGMAVGYAKIPPFIATLAMATIVRGVAYIYQVGSPRPITDDYIIGIGNLTLLNGWLPLSFLILLVTLLISWFVLTYLPFGRRLYAIGDNFEAACLSGLPVARSLLMAYMISGLMAGLAGVILASKLTLGSALVGSGYDLDAIASVVIGGASFAGGSGNPIMTVVGAYTFGLVANILNLLGVGGYPQMIIKGVLIAVALLAVSKKK